MLLLTISALQPLGLGGGAPPPLPFSPERAPLLRRGRHLHRLRQARKTCDLSFLLVCGHFDQRRTALYTLDRALCFLFYEAHPHRPRGLTGSRSDRERSKDSFEKRKEPSVQESSLHISLISDNTRMPTCSTMDSAREDEAQPYRFTRIYIVAHIILLVKYKIYVLEKRLCYSPHPSN